MFAKMCIVCTNKIYNIRHGIPQGANLIPFLFYIHINDLPMFVMDFENRNRSINVWSDNLKVQSSDNMEPASSNVNKINSMFFKK